MVSGFAPYSADLCRRLNARKVIAAWRIEYNTEGTHSLIGNLTPGEFALTIAEATRKAYLLPEDSKLAPNKRSQASEPKPITPVKPPSRSRNPTARKSEAMSGSRWLVAERYPGSMLAPAGKQLVVSGLTRAISDDGRVELADSGLLRSSAPRRVAPAAGSTDGDGAMRPNDADIRL